MAVNFPRASLVPDAILVRARHIESMTTYTIIPTDNGASFNIGIAGSDGTRQTMLGFISEAEAEAWITQDKRLNPVSIASAPQATATAAE